jgi:DNA-binding response OmpR family regulator
MSNNLDCILLPKFDFTPSNYNILIIEDSKSVNKILTKTFTNLGYKCFSSYTIKEAKEILLNTDIHYMMLDINLPDGSGYELISNIENGLEKVFILTAESDKEQRNLAYGKGIIDFIVKDKDFFYKIHEITTSIEQLEKNKFKTILVVDDSVVIQQQLKDILQNRFYNIELATDANIALEIINKKTIDLILLDVQLKNSNGIDFLRKYKNEIVVKRKIPVMIISGNVDTTIITDGLRAGAIDIIKKPFIIEEIVLKVDLWIDYKRKEQEILSSTKLLEEYKDAVDESSIVSKTTPLGIITYVNEQFCKLSGYSKEELIGNNHNILKHPDMNVEIFKDMWHTLKNLKKSWSGKIKNKKKMEVIIGKKH